MKPKAAQAAPATGSDSPTTSNAAEPASSAAVADVRKAFMRELTTHTDGIGLVSVLHALREHGVLEHLAGQREAGFSYTTLDSLVERFDANPGYLNVAMRALACQGWIERETSSAHENIRLSLTSEGYLLAGLLSGADCLARLSTFLPSATKLGAYFFDEAPPPVSGSTFEELVELSAREWDLPESDEEDATNVRERLLAHLDGNLMGPAVIALKDSRSFPGDPASSTGGCFFDQLGNPGEYVDVDRLRGFSRRLMAAFKLLQRKGWLQMAGNSVSLTPKGGYASRRGWSYGVPTSYMPTYAAAETLLFGDPEALRNSGPGQPERHVDRPMNVKASGGAHGPYFEAIDQVILDRFDLPFEQQPRGFADMGCGDGTWLEHVHRLVMKSTERGRLIRQFPDDPRYELVLVGADYNPAALEITRARLDAAGVPHLAVFGDVNDPAGFRDTLAQHDIDSTDLLHGSSFLVHNRPYTPPRDAAAAANRVGELRGAFAWRGRIVANNLLEQNLIEHFRDWSRIVGKHGMVILDLHDPERIEVGRTLTNYVLSHGLSDQFTMPLRVFLSAAREAGLTMHERFHRHFPGAADRATISVNYFTVETA